MKNNIMLRIASFILLALLFSQCSSKTSAGTQTTQSTNQGTVVRLTNESFKQKIFNYEANKEWKFLGNKPAIIDFYADWCGPCRMVSPLVEEIAKEYAGKIDVYKVDTDQERELSQNMGIQSLPTLLFIPLNGKPQASLGALPKENIVKAVNDVLLMK
jgi:thioredoxin